MCVYAYVCMYSGVIRHISLTAVTSLDHLCDVYVCMCVCVCVCLYVCLRVLVCKYVCMHVFNVCVCVRVHDSTVLLSPQDRMDMHVYIFTHIHTQTNSCMYMCMHAVYVYARMQHVYRFACLYACVHICIRGCIHACIHMYNMCVCVSAYPVCPCVSVYVWAPVRVYMCRSNFVADETLLRT